MGTKKMIKAEPDYNYFLPFNSLCLTNCKIMKLKGLKSSNVKYATSKFIALSTFFSGRKNKNLFKSRNC